MRVRCPAPSTVTDEATSTSSGAKRRTPDRTRVGAPQSLVGDCEGTAAALRSSGIAPLRDRATNAAPQGPDLQGDRAPGPALPLASAAPRVRRKDSAGARDRQGTGTGHAPALTLA